MAQNIVKVLEGEPKVEIEIDGDLVVLWQDQNQPCEDMVALSPSMQRQLRDFLNEHVKENG
jgi:hypothetical protein